MTFSASTHSVLAWQRRGICRLFPSSSMRSWSSIANRQSSSSLDLWFKAVADVPLDQILPIGLGNATERANVNAFFGDKRMNLEIAKILRRRRRTEMQSSSNETAASDELPSAGDVTTLLSLAVSNQLLSQCLPNVLPQHMNAHLTRRIQENSQIHDAGTMMEAAVDAVATSATPELADVAIAELASYLVDQAVFIQQQGPLAELYLRSTLPSEIDDDDDIEDTSSSTSSTAAALGDLNNPKGQLLNVGGTVEVTRREGFPDHAPQFAATAHFEDLTGTVNYGRTKKEAEQSAASMLWRYFSQVLTKKDMTCSAQPTAVYDEELENAKGRILSIGGVVTSEMLPEYPPHLPRFRAKCSKTFYVTQPMVSDSDSDADDDAPEKSSFTIEATAEGRTKYEAERIASTIVWCHVMNMPTTPTVSLADPMPSHETETDANDLDNLPLKEKMKIKKKQTAKQRRTERQLKRLEQKRISEYQVADNQLNFLPYEMEEQPKLVLRPGGETVIESWYRGALHPLAAFHRALIAPHVFPNHIATVNAFTRHNIIQPDDEVNDAKSLEAAAVNSLNEDAASNKDDSSMVTATTSSSIGTKNEEDSTTFSTLDDGWTPTDLLQESDGCELDTLVDSNSHGLDEDDGDEDRTVADSVKAAGVNSSYDPSNDDTDATTTFSTAYSESTTATEDVMTISAKDGGQEDINAMEGHEMRSLVSLDSQDAPGKPVADKSDITSYRDNIDLGTSPSNEKDSKEVKKKKSPSIKTYTTLMVVAPSFKHPLVRALGNDFNSSDLVAKCFVEHGRTPREARTAAGLAVNRYIIDILLKDYDYLLEGDQNKKKLKDSPFQAMSKMERKSTFFKF